MDASRRAGFYKTVQFIAVALSATVALSAYLGYRQRTNARQRIEAHISTWLESPRLMAKLMMERYGPPDDITHSAATWYGRGLWKRIAVHGGSRDKYIEHVVGYRTKPEAAAALRSFNHGVRVDPAKEELSAASNLEALNYLALNVADEVATGKRRVKDAREFYRSTARLAASGKSSEYLDGLKFKPRRFSRGLIGY